LNLRAAGWIICSSTCCIAAWPAPPGRTDIVCEG
jgi:hypothetical protein